MRGTGASGRPESRRYLTKLLIPAPICAPPTIPFTTTIALRNLGHFFATTTVTTVTPPFIPILIPKPLAPNFPSLPANSPFPSIWPQLLPASTAAPAHIAPLATITDFIPTGSSNQLTLSCATRQEHPIKRSRPHNFIFTCPFLPNSNSLADASAVGNPVPSACSCGVVWDGESLAPFQPVGASRHKATLDRVAALTKVVDGLARLQLDPQGVVGVKQHQTSVAGAQCGLPPPTGDSQLRDRFQFRFRHCSNVNIYF